MSAKTRRQALPVWVVPTIVLAIAAALIVVIFVVNRPSAAEDETGAQSEQTQDPDQPDFTELETRNENDLFAVGPVDAPVGLIVFSDYQCPYCAQWNEDTLPSMVERAEAGELRIEWHDAAIFGPASERAAAAVYAAASQGAFLEYHNALFEGGEHRPESELTEEALVALAGELGLDTEQFAQDMTSESALSAVEQNKQFAQQLGASSTPTFILGGTPMVGAQPTEVFVDAFEQALEQAG